MALTAIRLLAMRPFHSAMKGRKVSLFRTKFILCIGALVALALTLSACEEQGPAEELGEKIDESLNDANRAVKDAVD